MSEKPFFEELEHWAERLEKETKKRKRAKEALHQNEHFLKHYLAIAGVILVSLDFGDTCAVFTPLSLSLPAVLGHVRLQIRQADHWTNRYSFFDSGSSVFSNHGKSEFCMLCQTWKRVFIKLPPFLF